MFRRELRQNIQGDWKVWLAIVVVIAAFASWSELAAGNAARFTAFVAGGGVGILMFMVGLGGHISTSRWALGAEGERLTGKEIEKLGQEWHCEHSIAYSKNRDWDHVLIGPPGVFLVDSKFLQGEAQVEGDALRCGRLKYDGTVFRGSAVGLNKAIGEKLGRPAPFVRAVVAVWGNFPDECVEKNEVMYVDGSSLVATLAQRPSKLNAPERAALVTALTELRRELAVADRA